MFLYELAAGILLRIQYGECGAPSSYQDESGFCWACGIANGTYEIADKAIRKYGLK